MAAAAATAATTTAARLANESSTSRTISRVPFVDLEQRAHRLVLFLLGFVLIVFALVLMSKIYQTVSVLKYRNKHYGYYINPKYETILVNLNRQIVGSGRTLVHNFKKRQFIRVKKYDDPDETDSDGKVTNGMIEEPDECGPVSRYESGYVNQVFELDESSSGETERRQRRMSSEEDEETTGGKLLDKKQLVKGHFAYRRLGKSRPRKSPAIFHKCRARTRRATKMASYLVRKVLTSSSGNKSSKRRNQIEIGSEPMSEALSSTFRNVEFALPVILVTDTASMNTIIVDLEEL